MQKPYPAKVDIDSPHSPVSLAVTFEGWRGGVVPTEEGRRLEETGALTTAAVLAGVLGVSEVFQFLRGNPMAARRSVGLSLWAPDQLDWENVAGGPATVVFPSRLWLIGLGHIPGLGLLELLTSGYRVTQGGSP